MLFLSYQRPLTRENLPALAQAFARLKTRVRRRKRFSGFFGFLCFLLHTPMMILSSVGLYYRLTGEAFRAALDRLPHVKEILALCFETLPQRVGLRMQMPELIGLAAAVLVPPLACMVLALLLRLCLLPAGKAKIPENPVPEVLLADARELSKTARSRKANWTLLSGFLIMAAFGAAVVYSLIVVNPQSEDWNFKYILSYIFIGLVAFSVFQLIATLTDMILELLCGLDYQWEGDRLIGELEALLAAEAAAAAPQAAAVYPPLRTGIPAPEPSPVPDAAPEETR